VDCSNSEVLTACGRLAAAILVVAFSDPTHRQETADGFCKALMLCVNRSIAKERQQQHSAEMAIH
jgi:hypothetical protein